MSFIAMETNNPLGQRPLNLMSRQQGMGWLGATGPTPGDFDNNQQVLGELVSMGAITQQDATDIWEGQASLDDMAVNMSMINAALQLTGQPGAQTVMPLPGASDGGAQVVPYTPLPSAPAGSTLPIAPVVTSAGQIPPGSVISWTVSYTVATLGINGGPAPSSFIASFAAALSKYNYSMVSSKILASPVTGVLGGIAQIQFQILDSIGNALLTDAQSNLTALANSLTGNSVTASSIPQVISTPGAGGAPNNPPGAAPSFTSFLEQNAGMLAGLAVAIVVLPGLIKKL